MNHRAILPVLIALLFSLVPMQASAAAPFLQFDGVPDHRVVDVGVTVTVSFSDGAEVYRYDDAACSINPQTRGILEFTQVSGFAGTNWYQANTIGSPEEVSACLSITWQDPIGPTLTLNSGVVDVSAESGEVVTVATETGATIYRYNDSACTVGGFAGLPATTNSETHVGPATYYYEASWNDPARTGTSICLGVTWKEEVVPPRTPPQLWLNDGTSDVTVQSAADVTVSTEPGALLLQYSTSNCGVVPATINATSDTIGGIRGPYSYSYQAAWTDEPDVKSGCLNINWLAPGPLLELNGAYSDASVEVGQPIHFTSETGAQIVTYSTLDCTGVEMGRYDLEMTDTQSSPTSYSARAFWVGDSSVYSRCLIATWKPGPDPVPPPTLTLNGSPSDLTVALGETIVFESDRGTYLTAYETMDCSGPQLSGWTLPVDLAHTLPEAFSVQATDGTQTSACRIATWDGVPRTDPPPLMLNSVAGDIEVGLGESVVFESITGATILTFPNADCAFPQRPSARTSITETLMSPGSVSAVAVFGGLESPCYAASWIGPLAPDDGTPVEIETAEPSATASPNVSPTSTSQAAEKHTTVRIEMWDGSSIEGATWSLFAPVASQFHVEPYLTGKLDAGNRTVFIGLPTGEYRFVVEPPGMGQQEFTLSVADVSEEIILQILEPRTDSAPTAAVVTSLPKTGSGSAFGFTTISLASAGLSFILLAAGSRRAKV